MEKYIVSCKSMAGKRHIKKGEPCQDACASCYSPAGFLVVAAADGVSRSPFSEIASRKAVEGICSFWSNYASPYYDPESMKVSLRAGFNYALQQSKSGNELHNIPFSFETTLQTAVITPDYNIYYMYVGDGGMFLSDGTKITSLSTQMREEDGSVHTVADGPKFWAFGSARIVDFQYLLMVTDGINDVLQTQKKPETEIQFIADSIKSDKKIDTALYKLLRMDPFNDIDDDITVLLVRPEQEKSMSLQKEPNKTLDRKAQVERIKKILNTKLW